jgi:hypothetical protein
VPFTIPLHAPKQSVFVVVKTETGLAITVIVFVAVVVPVPLATVNEIVFTPLVA